MSEANRITDPNESAQTENQETIEQPSAEAPAEAELDMIPEKFVGKSPMEIIQAYNNLEKHSSKVSSERSEERKKREALEDRIKDLELRAATPQSQPAQHTVETSPETDPFAEYEEQIDTNPKEAIKKLVKSVRNEVISESERRNMREEQQRATEYHLTQKAANPEYAKLEPTMLQLSQEFADLVHPSKASSVKALKLLHLAAKGARMEDYLSEATSKAKKESQSVKEEKRSAFSESSAQSKTEGKKSIKDMTVEEIEALYGIARQS
jgi:hypothetical protein